MVLININNNNNDSNLCQTTRPSDNQQQKKRTCRKEDFAVPGDHSVKLKEEKKAKYLDLIRKRKKNYGTWKWWWYQL